MEYLPVNIIHSEIVGIFNDKVGKTNKKYKDEVKKD
jgi:hypothetical protein